MIRAKFLKLFFGFPPLLLWALMVLGAEHTTIRAAALEAERDILLEASANRAEIHSTSSSSSFGGGATLSFGGQQNGLSFQLNAGQSRGKTNGSETTWDNTLVSSRTIGNRSTPQRPI